MKVLLLLIIFYLFDNVSAVSYNLGLLHSDNEDNYDLTNAFKYAIARHNMFTEENVYFKPILLEISDQDMYQASKIACSMTSSEDGVAAVFGPASAQISPMIQSVCANLEIPHLQVSWRLSMAYNTQTVLNFYPETDLLAQGIGMVLQHLQWKRFAILYQNTEGLLRLQEVLKQMKITDSPTIIRQLDADGDYRTTLKIIKQTTITQVVVDCNLDVILPFLEQAKDIDFLDYFHYFFFTALDAHTLDYSSLDSAANITTIRIVDPENPLLHHAIRDWEVGELNSGRFYRTSTSKIKTEVALMLDAVNLFMTTLTQLHITQPIETKPLYCNNTEKWNDGYRLVSYMKVKDTLSTATGPFKFNEEGKRIGFRLQQVEIIRNVPTVVALWSSESPKELELIRSASEHSQQIIQNLQKTVVVVSSRIGAPYLMWREKTYPGEVLEGNARFEGYSLDLIDAIAQNLNFTYKFVLSKDAKYGNYDPKTKSWNGIIKDLLDRRAHLGICDLTVTFARRQVVDFSMPFMTLGVSILYRSPLEEERSLFAFMDPLEVEVWLYICTAFIGLTIIIYLIARMAPGDWENPNPADENPEELENTWTLLNCVWLLLGSTMSQGCDILPKGVSSRMAISMWWFLILIINSSYTANLAAFLTMSRKEPTITNVEALAKQTKIKYGTLKDGSTEAFFRDSNYSIYKKMYTMMIQTKPSVFEKSNADGVKRVLTTKNQLYAFLMESSSIEYETERNCDLKRIGNRLDSKSYGIAMPMNAPYRGEINKVVLKLQESGELNLLKKKWWKEMHGGGACDDIEEEGNADELALANVGGIFIVVGVGLGVAFAFAIIEFLWHVRQVSVEEHVSYWQALWAELKFVVNIHITKKRVNLHSNKSNSSSENALENKSIAPESKSVGSLLQLEVTDKISLNNNL